MACGLFGDDFCNGPTVFFAKRERDAHITGRRQRFQRFGQLRQRSQVAPAVVATRKGNGALRTKPLEFNASLLAVSYKFWNEVYGKSFDVKLNRGAHVRLVQRPFHYTDSKAIAQPVLHDLIAPIPPLNLSVQIGQLRS